MEKVGLLVLCLCVAFGAFGQQDKLQTVTGKIVDAKGQPIPKAKVVLYYYQTRWGMGNRITEETKSGTEGLFTFKDPLKYGDAKQYPYGRDSYVLLASHPDYAFGWKKIDREQEQARYEIILTEPKSQTITVTDHDGKPLAGARVWPYNVGSRADSEPLFRDSLSLPTYVDIVGGTTGADGKAIIKNLPKTRCSFYADLKGYAKGLSFSGDRPIRLSKGATVSGIISDEDGNPVQGALVKFHTEWMWNFFLSRTNSQGKFRIEDLPAEGWDMSSWGNSANANGIYVINIEHNDYIASETQDQFQPGEVVKDFTIEACRGTLIKCHVVDAKSNIPIAGARIYGSNESGRIDKRTNADGVLTVRVMSGQTSLFFGSPPEGVYVLRGQSPPESSLRFDAQGEEITVTLKTPPIAGRLTSVKGKVQLPDGSPAADIKISTTNSASYNTLTWTGAGGAYTGTSSDGSFELKDVPVGLKLFIYGNTKDYQYVLAEVIDNVKDPTVLSTPLVMQRGQVADILLADKRDELCANLSVKIKPVMWGNRVFRANYHNGKTDAEGRLKINGIIPGMEYYVMDSRAESGPRDMYYTQTIALIPLKEKERKITSFAGIDIGLEIDQAKGKVLLICFWDMEQRPSRNCMIQLSKKVQELKEKEVVVIAVQASKVDKSALSEWVKKQNIPFPIGMIQGDKEKTCFTWGVRSLPWLILTDKEHIVTAKGFGLSQLNEKLQGDGPDGQVENTAESTSDKAVLQGLVTEPNGRPIADTEVLIRGIEKLGERAIAHPNTKTDEQGHYRYDQIDWPYIIGFLWNEELSDPNAQRYQYVRLCRLFQGSQTVDFRFEEFPRGTAGLSIRVTDQHSQVPRGFRVNITSKVDYKDYSKDLHLYGYKLLLDTADGRFKLNNLPAGVYWVEVYHPTESLSYESFSSEVTLEQGATANIKCDVIKKPTYYGRILFEDGTPAIADPPPWPRAETSVTLDHPAHSGISFAIDSRGYFTASLTNEEFERIKTGKSNLYVYYPSWEDPNASYRVGTFPVKLLSQDESSAGTVKIRKPTYQPKVDLSNALSLVGKPMPELKDLGIDLPATDVNEKIILLYFFDMEQRSSRNCVSQLAKQAEQLNNKGVTVVAVQASKVDKNALSEWVNENNIPFPVGMVQDDTEKVCFAWGVKSLPWLILSDHKQIVHAEGFVLSDLDEKVKQIDGD